MTLARSSNRLIFPYSRYVLGSHVARIAASNVAHRAMCPAIVSRRVWKTSIGGSSCAISYANAAGSDANSMSQAQLHLGDAAHAALWGMSK